VDANRRKGSQLTYEEVIRVIGEIEKAGSRHLVITGGEALTRPDIFDILRFAGDSRIPRITLATNGYLVEKFRNELSKTRIDRVVTSIDDVGETNDLIRGKKGAFKNALKALDIFKEIGVPERFVNTTVLPGKVSRMEELAKFIAASSATSWTLGLLVPIGRAHSLQERYFEDEELIELIRLIKKIRAAVPVELMSHTGYLKNYFKDVTSEPFYCRAGIETCSINPDGEVMPCNITSDKRFSEGNIREKDFRTIWEEGFEQFRSPNLPPGCKSCEFLPACGGGCWGYRVINEKFCYRDFCV